MKFVIAFVGLFAVARAGLAPIILPATTTLVRSPSHDSAIVRSERIGGNFAYSTLEGHAYKAFTPAVQSLQYDQPLITTYALRTAPIYTTYLTAPQATYTYVQQPETIVSQQPAFQPAFQPAVFPAGVEPSYPSLSFEGRETPERQPEQSKLVAPLVSGDDDTIAVESA